MDVPRERSNRKMFREPWQFALRFIAVPGKRDRRVAGFAIAELEECEFEDDDATQALRAAVPTRSSKRRRLTAIDGLAGAASLHDDGLLADLHA